MNSLTPLQALNLLEELQQELKKKDQSDENESMMTDSLRRRREVCWWWAWRHGTDRPGARVAEAGAAGGHDSVPAQHCGCAADAGTAE